MRNITKKKIFTSIFAFLLVASFAYGQLPGTLTYDFRDGEIINDINIYNQLGQKVLQETRFTKVIDVSMLRQGMYVVEVVAGDWVVRQKLVVR